MTPHEIKSYLNSFINHELNLAAVAPADFKLHRVERLLEELGNPHQQVRCIHVAGTKGKGSTCAFAASILKQAGYKVGLYTSPHLKSFKERIRILNGSASSIAGDEIFPDCITDEQLADTLQVMKPALEKFRHTAEYGALSYYEIMTALAFVHFQREGVDCAVLETGLGGRLDATNVVDSLVCGLTPVSLDHTNILGSTLGAIAREKAAIIKNNRPIVILAPQEKEAADAIDERCRAQQVTVLAIGIDINYELVRQDLDGLVFQVRGFRREYRLKTQLLGHHQMINAAVAIGMVEALELYDIPVSQENIEQGIACTQWPGRFEIVRRKPLVILDCAHNPSSVRQLVNTVNELFPGKKIKLVFGVSEDKDRAEICKILNQIAGDVIVTKANQARAHEFSMAEAKDLFSGQTVTMARNIPQAMDLVIKNSFEEDVILAVGSVFVAGEAREYFVNKAESKHV